MWASTLATGARPGAMLFKFATNEDRQGALRGRKGLVGTKLGLDENLTLHAGIQVGAVAVIQRGQGGKQVHLLTRNQAFHQWHSDLPSLLYLGLWGPKRPMHGIMKHAQGWCK
jgi:hypothetical protein